MASGSLRYGSRAFLLFYIPRAILFVFLFSFFFFIRFVPVILVLLPFFVSFFFLVFLVLLLFLSSSPSCLFLLFVFLFLVLLYAEGYFGGGKDGDGGYDEIEGEDVEAESVDDHRRELPVVRLLGIIVLVLALSFSSLILRVMKRSSLRIASSSARMLPVTYGPTLTPGPLLGVPPSGGGAAPRATPSPSYRTWLVSVTSRLHRLPPIQRTLCPRTSPVAVRVLVTIILFLVSYFLFLFSFVSRSSCSFSPPLPHLCPRSVHIPRSSPSDLPPHSLIRFLLFLLLPFHPLLLLLVPLLLVLLVRVLRVILRAVQDVACVGVCG